MRTNIVIDDDLLSEAFFVSDAKTKKALVEEVLEVLIRLKKRRGLTELAGKVEFYEDYDHKKMRQIRE